jgi:hypothetical protein
MPILNDDGVSLIEDINRTIDEVFKEYDKAFHYLGLANPTENNLKTFKQLSKMRNCFYKNMQKLRSEVKEKYKQENT